MANLTESAIYEAGIYQLETTDPVLGGVSGIANLQGKQLANRTKWLKEKVDLLGFGTTGATAFTGNVNLVVETGWYYVTGASTNRPAASDGWMNVVKYVPEDYILQVYYCASLDLVFWRKIYDGPTYGQWNEFATQATINTNQSQMVGMVSAFAFNFQPPGWLKCNGAAVSRSTYADLFAKVGTTFGVGNGSTTFNLPDLRGEFIRGWADGHTVDNGRVFGSAQADELKSHFHLVKKNNYPRGTGTNFFAMDDAGVDGSENTESTGGTETRPRNVALLYCIKY